MRLRGKLQLDNRREIMRRLLSRRIYSATISPNVVGKCWLYHGGANSDGYGYMRIGEKVYPVQRISAFLWHGMSLDSEEWVRHQCVNSKACFNPRHLLPGTPAENNADTVFSGRNRNAAMTDTDVRRLIYAVRSGRMHVGKWAAGFGIAYSTALAAYKGRTHREIAEQCHKQCDTKYADSGVVSPLVALPPASEGKRRAIVLPEEDSDYQAIESGGGDLPF